MNSCKIWKHEDVEIEIVSKFPVQRIPAKSDPQKYIFSAKNTSSAPESDKQNWVMRIVQSANDFYSAH